MKPFNLRLSKLIKSKRSHLCVGLDMNPEAMGSSNTTLDELKKHAFKVIDATSDLSSAFKPNLAFFERWGSEGFKWLEELMDYFPDDLIIIGDAKRGDIGNTAKQYAYSLFTHFDFDAVTLSPYMGKDSITPFIDNPEKGAFILCRTSNPSAVDLQNQQINIKSSDQTLNSIDEIPNEMLFDKTAQLCVEWNKNNNVGIVVGATAPKEISRIRNHAPSLPFLIPGIGAQGGDLTQSMVDGNKNGDALINISRGISFSGDLSSKAIRNAAKDYLSQMREIIDI
ncbi:MAG: orotidine-5'-phosphate decarboxylase [Candidatus Neomarinimicrobiota bacterium]